MNNFLNITLIHIRQQLRADLIARLTHDQDHDARTNDEYLFPLEAFVYVFDVLFVEHFVFGVERLTPSMRM